MDIRVSLETSAENHAGKLRVGGKTIRCFTRAQLKAFHPQGSYKILGEIRLPDERIQPYRRHKRLLYAEKGYWRCGQGVYVALIRRVWPTRLAFTAVLCAAVLGICFSWSALRTVLESFSAAPASSVSIASADLDKDAEDYVGEKPENKGNPNAASTQIPGYKSITADAKTGKLSVALMNPEGNPCYFVIHILVDDRELYASKMLAPGKAIYEAGLEKILPKGTYAATIKYECFHLESLAPLNGADIQVELIVA